MTVQSELACVSRRRACKVLKQPRSTQRYSRAIRCRIEPLKAFARKPKEYLPGILARCRWPLDTSFLEGIN